MILCLDIGNSNIFAGVFANSQLQFSFRYPSKQADTSDQFGVFLRNVIRENNCDPKKISHIAVCSVVPSLDYSIRAACIKYFAIKPFVLQVGAKTGLKIKIKNPLELGADRIANAIGAIARYPQKNLIVIDFGTATTFDAISSLKEYLGGAILPGIQISMQALHQNAAKLGPVSIVKPKQVVGRSTVENIQSGLYYSTLGASKELIARIQEEVFTQESAIIIATGGFAHLFQDADLFHVVIPDLVFQGLLKALKMNMEV